MGTHQARYEKLRNFSELLRHDDINGLQWWKYHIDGQQTSTSAAQVCVAVDAPRTLRSGSFTFTDGTLTADMVIRSRICRNCARRSMRLWIGWESTRWRTPAARS